MTTRWLDADQQRAWRAYIIGTTLLLERLDRDLRDNYGVSLPEYEILVRLSEAPERRLRMAQLADSVKNSRSRITHTIARMQRGGLVDRTQCTSDGRGVYAHLTEAGWQRLVDGVDQGVVDGGGDVVAEESGVARGGVAARPRVENILAD